MSSNDSIPCQRFYGECRALCEIVGWINTASPRISSIQDNLIPEERAPPAQSTWCEWQGAEALLQKGAEIFLSLLPDKRENEVEKHKDVPPPNFSLLITCRLSKVITCEVQILITVIVTL